MSFEPRASSEPVASQFVARSLLTRQHRISPLPKSEEDLYERKSELQSQDDDDVANCPGGARGTGWRASSHGRSSEESCSELVFLFWPERGRATAKFDWLGELRWQAGAGGAGGYIGVFNRHRGEIPGLPDHRNQTQLRRSYPGSGSLWIRFQGGQVHCDERGGNGRV